MSSFSAAGELWNNRSSKFATMHSLKTRHTISPRRSSRLPSQLHLTPQTTHRIPLSKLALKVFPVSHLLFACKSASVRQGATPERHCNAVRANSWVVTHGYSGPPLRLVPPIMFLQAHDNSMSIQIESSVVILHHQGKNDSTNHDINAVSFP
jgi:hypothetical protein